MSEPVTGNAKPSQLSVPGRERREVNDIRKNVLQFTPCGASVYLWLESRAEIINVSYRMDSAIAPDRHSAAAERVDSSFVLVAKVS